jgi:hypothetical protein
MHKCRGRTPPGMEEVGRRSFYFTFNFERDFAAMTTAFVLHVELLTNPLFFNGEIRLAKNLADLDHIARLRGATLRPFHDFLF